jgi:GLPGLI family protein
MNKIIFTGLCLLPLLSHAQSRGIIVYETRSTATISANGVEQKMPSRVAKNELLFASAKSLFRNIPSMEEDQKFQNGGSSIGFQVDNRLRMQYHDYDKKERLSNHELGDKEYIQRSSIPDLHWVLVDEIKTILNLPCKKAMGTIVRNDFVTRVENSTVTVSKRTDTLTVFAWYTLNIPLPVGPDKYTGLPGAVLQVENNKGRILFEAVSIKEEVKQKDIEPPTRGKLLSAEEFENADKEYREKSTRARNGL